MQLQADLAQSPVEVAADADATALGAAALAGLASASGGTRTQSGRCCRRGARYEPRSARARWPSCARTGGGRCAGDDARVTIVIAHRGASAEERENTLPAFERAIELGADYVEFDVQASSDGALVVFHDLRSTGSRPPRGRCGRPLEALRELGIPTLEDVLELTAGRIGVMAEIKSPWLFRRHDIVAPDRRRSYPPTAVVVSFSRTRDPRDATLRPTLRTVQHVGFGASIRAAGGFAWAAGFADARVSARGIAKARALGLQALVYTVNDAGTHVALRGIGVDGVFTDLSGSSTGSAGSSARLAGGAVRGKLATTCVPT